MDDDAGVFPVKINIVNEDGKSVVPPIETRLEVVIPNDGVFFTRNMVFNMQHVKFEGPGSYSIDVTINGRPVAGIPFRIAQYQPQAGKPPANP